jgi:prepilin-type N-terminal cleavage/methylation domain-containing protein
MLAYKLKVVRAPISPRVNKGISYTKRHSGFTLIELIIVIILLGKVLFSV